jgi:V/A-type H+-transporting ATPase subunit E
MGLEDILHAMEEEAGGETAEIVAEAETTAGRMVTEAEARSQQVRERHRQGIIPTLSAEEARIMNEARLEALKTVMQTREELIDRAFQAAQRQLSGLRSQADYPVMLQRWIQEVVEELGEDLVVDVGEEDVGLVRSLLEEMEARATIKSSLDSAGGLSATSGDGRILVVNTIDSRLENARQVLRREVANMILEKDGDASRL